MNTSDHTTKHCSKCGKEYPLTDEFWYKDKRAKDGYFSCCKECQLKANKKWRDENPEKSLNCTRNWQSRNYDRCKSNILRWSKENRKKVLGWEQRRFRNNPEKLARKRDRLKLWRKENQDRVKERNNARRALKLNAEGSHAMSEVRLLYAQQNGKCFHCGIELNGKYHEDHWIPLSRGGSDWISNIRLLCPRCNLSKNKKLPCEWDNRYCN